MTLPASENKTDFHIHTSLSPCASPEAHVCDYIANARALGMRTLGFANHLWDAPLDPHWSRYRYLLPQTIENLLTLRRELDGVNDIELLFGCETEMKIDGTLAIRPEHAPLFDYILIPTTHLNMPDVAIDPSVREPREVRRLMLDRFVLAAESRLARDFHTALCHPFVPYGFWDIADELLDGITDSEYEYCFSMAAGLDIPVEVNSRMLSHEGMSSDAHGFPCQFIRIMTIARECGCRIYPGSDSHEPGYFSAIHSGGSFDRFAEVCGIKYSRLL